MPKRYRVEKEWETKAGYKAVVLVASRGFRTGYVAVHIDHPFFGKEYSDESSITLEEKETDFVRVDELIDVHGGVTYSGSSEDSYPVETREDLWWFGFGCNHAWDLPDVDLAWGEGKELVEKDITLCRTANGTVKTLEYCIEECERMAEQLRSIEEGMIWQE